MPLFDRHRAWIDGARTYCPLALDWWSIHLVPVRPTLWASVGSRVALSSLVWMIGVLAAQFRGGCALLAMVGFTPTVALVLIDGTLLALSISRLSWLSAGFAICMLASIATLVGSLVQAGKIGFRLRAPVHFVQMLQQRARARTGLTLISIVLMVLCGADYQQFLIATRTPAAARAGCILATAIVFARGFLPPSVVIVASAVGHLDHLGPSRSYLFTRFRAIPIT